MLGRQVIMVGKWYVNNKRKVARAVLKADEKVIQFSTHHLDSGNSCDSFHECTRQEFARWADREASPAETVSLQHQKREALLRGTHSPNWEASKDGAASDSSTVES